MLKNISNLGSILNKSDQQSINGGGHPTTPSKCLSCNGIWVPQAGVNGSCLLPWTSECLG
ncbi:hypothetical protein SAMN04489761_0125 [Tenacibaculum sp. MAR_2009_124]|uniref:hypothetical protein n=1 Tax=Tenacibaculum sp. MAR_2009_124 TaxID=1250059 RepID=UPI000898F0C4|nr:hypothetical protein [Tenacibaculum sp. MAR_2009_124]SEB36126.1 hypothetical protein SAMN04489761_0125 [Tenacibaculum sp. MAR_2009_124]